MLRRDIDQLLDRVGSPVVSLFLTLHGGDGSQRARFAGLLREAEAQLAAMNLDPAQAAAIVEPARDLLDGPPRGPSLALYLSAGHRQLFELADPVEQRVLVAHRPVLAPLMREVELDQAHVVLALDRKEPRLWIGDRHELRGLADVTLPTLDDIRAVDDVEPTLQLHTGTTSRAGDTAVFHGHGGSREIEQQQLDRWMRAVAAAVDTFLASRDTPVVLVGVAEQVAAFRRASSHPGIAPTAAHGSPHGLSPTELRERTWPIMLALRADHRRRDLERLAAHRGTAWVREELDEVHDSADLGQVDVLFVSIDSGPFEPIVEEAVAATWRAGGRVHVLEDALPTGVRAAAILRFAVPSEAEAGAAPTVR